MDRNIVFREAKECIDLQLKILKYSGFWRPETKNKFILFLYQFYSIVVRILFLYANIASQIMFLLTANDLTGITSVLSILLTEFAMMPKLQPFLTRYEQIHEIVRKIDSDFCKAENIEENKLLLDAIKQSSRIRLTLPILAYLTLVFWTIYPMLDVNSEPLPVAAWYPFSTKETLTLYITYLHQFIFVLININVNSSLDSFFVALMAIANYQLRIIGRRWSEIGYHEKVQVLTKNVNKLQMIEMRTAEEKEYYHQEMVKNLKLHQEVLKFIRDIEKLIKFPTFVQIATAAILLCVTAFQLLVIPPKTFKYASVVFYLFAISFEIFSYCVVGNEIIFSSEKLLENAYFCNFILFDKRTSKTLTFFMQKVTNEVKIEAKGIFRFTLSLSTFMAIIKASYSYFAVLQSMQNA